MNQLTCVLYEKIFSKILSEAAANGFLDTESLFIDGAHIKASANSHKYHNEVIRKEAYSYEKELQEEIKRDRQEHGKKPLKEKEKEPEMITQKAYDSSWLVCQSCPHRERCANSKDSVNPSYNRNERTVQKTQGNHSLKTGNVQKNGSRT